MSQFDLGQQSNVQYGHVTYAATDTNTNVNSTAIDTAGYAGVAVALVLGKLGGGVTTINAGNGFKLGLYESDDNTRANATAVAASRVVNETDEATAENTVAYYSVAPTKRYVFGEFTKTNAAAAATNANFAVVGVLGFPNDAPTS